MKIIILDDSLTVRIILESFLEDLGVRDDEMHSFEYGQDALDFIDSNGADLVFSDINMPKMSGQEFALALFVKYERLRSSFFSISGDESRSSYREMKESGVHRFLKKPINFEHFNHFVRPEILKLRAMEELLKT